MRLAEMMARGKLVPTHLHNSPGDCLMVVEQAMRWGMSPFAVAQCTSVISGKLMFEGKLVAAALNASGILSGRLEYEYAGAGANRAVTVRGTLKGEAKPREVTVKLDEVKTNNQFWTKQPDQQLVYAGTRVWARRHAPEVMLGVYSPEEFEAPRADTFAGTTIDAAPDGPPAGTREAINAAVPLTEPTHHRRTVKAWLADVARELEDTANIEEVEAIVAREDVQKALAALTNGALTQLTETIARVRSAMTPVAIADDGWPGPDVPAAGDARE
ncbi:MAG: recombinase RecT [Gemmatimonadaceae bacterium]